MSKTEQRVARLRLADLLAALSIVTDLGHGQPPEDAMRACLLATRLAHQMRLGAQDVADVYYTTLLRYVGCTASAHEEAALFGGDEIGARAAVAMIDLGDPHEALSFWLFHVAKDSSPLRRARVVGMGLARGRQAVKDLAASNCEVGAAVARRVGLGFAVQEALQRSTSIVRRASIVAAADAYQAMTQERPYRPALAPVAAAEQLSADAGRGRLDGEVVRAVLTVAGHRRTRPRAAWPAGLSDREVDVLRRKACISIVTWGTAQPGGPASRSHPST